MRFQVGEIAVTARATITGDTPAGTECEVLVVGPIPANQLIKIPGVPFRVRFEESIDYVIDVGRALVGCRESFIRKRPRQGIPDQVLAIFESKLPKGVAA